MIEITIQNRQLLLKYLPYNPIHWIIEKFAENNEVVISKIFHFTKEHIFNNEPIADDDSEVLFVIANLVDGYWKIDTNTLNVDYDISISQDYTITVKTFQSGTGLSVFREIFKIIQENIWCSSPAPCSTPCQAIFPNLARA